MHVLRNRPRDLFHDHETFSVLNLPDVGLDRYARHSSTEILMTAFAYDEEPEDQWVPAEGEPMPAKLEDALLDERVVKHAWNSPFERYIWKHTHGIDIPIRQWKDTMILAMSVSLPGKLEPAGEVLKLDEEFLKMKGGKALMNWFSKMRPATTGQPERRVEWWQKKDKWEEYKLYNRRDVRAEQRMHQKLRSFDLPEHEWELWWEDQEINDAGIPIDFEFAAHCEQVSKELIDRRIADMARITGLDNPNAQAQLLPWLQERGYPFNDLKKGHVRRALAALEEDQTVYMENKELADVLELRLESAQAAVKKYAALTSHGDPEDNVLRNTLQFAGAQRTWRWGGRVFQPQNLVKPAGYLEGLEWQKLPSGAAQVVGGPLIKCRELVADLDADTLEMVTRRPVDYVSACVRPTVVAPDGHLLLDADYKAIENVVLGWLADDKKILRVFRDGLDPYIDFATYLFKEAYAKLWAEYQAGKKKKRTTAKPGVLGCGYMLGAGHEYEDHKTGEIEATGLLGYAWDMGIRDFTPEESALSVAVWRETFKGAVNFWYDIERAAFHTVTTGKSSSVRHIGFDMKRGVLRMHLPSGRCLHYIRPRLVEKMMPWGKKKTNLQYEGLQKGIWVTQTTHPGKLTENADQAVSRDLLAHGIRSARREGIDVRLHVHDQIVALSPEDEAETRLALLKQCMTDLPGWAKGMPVGVAGHISKWFVKD